MAIIIEQNIVDIIIKKIKNAEINPKTNKPFVLEDIKIQEYKECVQKTISI